MSNVVNQTLRTCAVAGCEGVVAGRGWCKFHWQRWSRNGDPLVSHTRRGTGSTPEMRFWSHVALTADANRCWIWMDDKDPFGYGRFGLNYKRHQAHRFAWQLVKGVEPAQFLLHTCPGGDNPACVNPNHLREGTQAENMQDKVDRGRTHRGEKNHAAKLTEQQVQIIKELLRQRVTQNKIAARFAVSQGAISEIKRGRNWSWVS